MKEAQSLTKYHFREETFYNDGKEFHLQVIIWGHIATVLAFDFDENNKWFVLSQSELYEDINLSSIIELANKNYPNGPIENWGGIRI